ncbi:MAG: hypothetical protein OHK0013_01900 [Sandaracinaceae bacterium]
MSGGLGGDRATAAVNVGADAGVEPRVAIGSAADPYASCTRGGLRTLAASGNGAGAAAVTPPPGGASTLAGASYLRHALLRRPDDGALDGDELAVHAAARTEAVE